MTTTWFSRPAARTWLTAKPVVDAIAFHRTLPRYAATRLVELPSLAAELGVAHVVVKDESERLGLSAFKILGASFAIATALSRKLGSDTLLPLDELRGIDELRVICATDGNHGRAVAHMARLVGLPVSVHVPDSITIEAQRAIVGEGAQLTVHAVSYDEVVKLATAEALELGDKALLVQDSSWLGYSDIPGWIVDGYSTLFIEADAQLAELGLPPATLVTAPTGVGALAEAAIDHYRRGAANPTVLIVEPESAGCVLRSLRTGHTVAVETDRTPMNGLNCGVVSPGAWPTIRDGADAAITVTDDAAIQAVRDLKSLGVDSGPCGASSLAAVRALCADPARRVDAGVDEHSVLLLLNTEGLAANPVAL
jgi:diaminopropionate ammonia-lyase